MTKLDVHEDDEYGEPESVMASRQVDTCSKRAFRGVSEARHAISRASWRARIYQCDVCGFYHVTQAEKR